MPPKKGKGADKPGTKAIEKKKDKIIEDKTFGLKNKKGTKQQKFISQVTSQVKHGNMSSKQKEAEREKEKTKDKKNEAARLQAELNALFKPAEQKVAKGVDPKSVLCAFYKQGQCHKGDKCKFSHDINIGRKSEKRNMYEDDKADNEMENWDEEELQDVINKKHGEANKSLPPTSIICKYFLEAVESSKYGWFWTCPNGGEKCHYKHALPPGFVLKKDKKVEDAAEKITMEELIEKERAGLDQQKVTKITLESFVKWKKRKRQEKIASKQKDEEKKKAEYKAGKMLGISGREMFEFNPDLIVGDDDDVGDDAVDLRAFKRDDEEDEAVAYQVKEINLDLMQEAAQEIDGTGTVADGMKRSGVTSQVNGLPNGDKEENKLEMAAGGATEEAIQAAQSAIADDFDADLFDGDDIDLVDEELEQLELNS